MIGHEPEEFDEMGEAEFARNFGCDFDGVDAQLSGDVERVEEVAAEDKRVAGGVLKATESQERPKRHEIKR